MFYGVDARWPINNVQPNLTSVFDGTVIEKENSTGPLIFVFDEI